MVEVADRGRGPFEPDRKTGALHLAGSAEGGEEGKALHEGLPELITPLEERMKAAAKRLEFEEAANLRDRIRNLRQKLVGRA